MWCVIRSKDAQRREERQPEANDSVARFDPFLATHTDAAA
jgi:hypothetical protein